jgi:myosin heavy subunit
MGSSQTHSEDFANTAAELADRLGCILQSLSDVPHNGGKQIHLALEVHKALCHCLSRSDWYEAGSPDSTAEYLAKLQTLQTDNIALQEKLTQSDLKVKKMESDNSRLSKECTSLQKQVKALSDDLARLKLMEKKDHEVGTTMHRLRTELEMSQSEIRMSRMALAEKEGQLSRAHDESLALRHCIAGFLTEATRSRQGNVAQVGWKVPLSLIQKFQELADCGNTQGFLDSLEEPTDQVSDSSLMTTTVDSDISLRDAQHLEGVLLSDKRSTTTLSDLIDTELKDVASSSKKVAKLPYVHQLQAPPRDDLSFQSEATTQTTSSERQFRTELAALDAEIAKLQLQFQTAAAAAN